MAHSRITNVLNKNAPFFIKDRPMPTPRSANNDTILCMSNGRLVPKERDQSKQSRMPFCRSGCVIIMHSVMVRLLSLEKKTSIDKDNSFGLNRLLVGISANQSKEFTHLFGYPLRLFQTLDIKIVCSSLCRSS